MKISKVIVSPAELLLAEVRAGKTLSSSPFGTDGGVWYTKRPVFWKGVKGEEFWKLMEASGEKARRLAEGLRFARDLSKKHREVGVALVERVDGVYEIVPLKCARMMEEQGNLKRILQVAPTALALYSRAFSLGMLPRL